MAELRTALVIDLVGNLQRQARRYSQALGTFSSTGRRHLSILKRAGSALGTGLDRLGNRYSALITGAAGAGAVRMLVALEQRMTRLGIQANVGAEEVDALKRAIFEVSQQSNVRIDPSQLTSAIEEIVEKTGDLDFARENLESLALAISATGAEGAAIGGIAAEFQKMGITARKDLREALEILTVQGKEGAFTLQNLAALGPRVVTAYTAMGRTGVPAIREMGAALQVIRQGTGDAAMAASAFEAVLRTLGDADKVKILQRGGIQVFDVEALKEGREVLRPINELMVEIIERSRGARTVIGTVFDAEAVRAFNAAASEFQRTGAVNSLGKFMSVQADGGALLQDSARAAATASSALNNLFTAWKQFADSNLTGPIQSLADTLNSLDPQRVQQIMGALGTGAVALGGLVVANKAIKGVAGAAGLMQRIRGKGGAAGAVAGALGASGATPVFVVNMPGGGLVPGAGGVPGGAKGARSPGGRFGGFRAGAAMLGGTGLSQLPMLGAGALATAGLAVGAAGGAGYGAGTLLAKTIENTSFYDAIGEGIARGLAALGNENARAALDARAAVDLRIQVDEDGRVRRVTPSVQRGGDVDVEVDAGMMMAMP